MKSVLVIIGLAVAGASVGCLPPPRHYNSELKTLLDSRQPKIIDCYSDALLKTQKVVYVESTIGNGYRYQNADVELKVTFTIDEATGKLKDPQVVARAATAAQAKERSRSQPDDPAAIAAASKCIVDNTADLVLSPRAEKGGQVVWFLDFSSGLHPKTEAKK